VEKIRIYVRFYPVLPGYFHRNFYSFQLKLNIPNFIATANWHRMLVQEFKIKPSVNQHENSSKSSSNQKITSKSKYL
jgi:hypothetical protein